MRLVGTTKSTIASIRDRTHWNSANLTPMDPVTLGLASQIDLDLEVQRANKEKPAPVDAQEPLIDPTRRPIPRHQVRQRCQRTADPCQRRHVAEDPIAQGQAMLAIIPVQKLGLEPGHIDIGRALALARLAFETEVEHLVYMGIGEPLET